MIDDRAQLAPVPAVIAAAYDAERFRHDGQRLIDVLAEHLAAAHGRDPHPVLPWQPPAAAQAAWPGDFTDAPSEDLVALLTRTAASSIRLHHPRYVGHQVPPPLPAAALADATAALLNNGMAVYEMGIASTAMEDAVIGWMARALDLPDTAGGVLTSGGSAGNLTALLAARQAQAGFDVWTEGAHAGPPLAVLVATSAHYSIARAVRVLGWGDGGAVAVAVDARHRMRPDDLPRALAAATAAGRKVIAVVASAGSTATGAFDPLPPIADFCAAHQLWLHVDGAHGASAALAPRHRHLLAGVERADSVVWDAHKLLAMPALCTAVLYRDARRSYHAFAQDASYLFADDERPWWDLGLRTLECTKRMMSTILYASLRAHGVEFFRAYVERTFALGAALAARVEAAPDLELAVPPDANIVCFRHRPTPALTGAALDAHQAHIRQRCLERGHVYFVQTRLDGALWLRCALMNPLIEGPDLDELLATIRAAATAG